MLSVRNHAQDSGKSPRSNIPTPPTPQMNLDAHHAGHHGPVMNFLASDP